MGNQNKGNDAVMTKERLEVKVEKAVKKDLAAYANENGFTMSGLINKLLKGFLSDRKKTTAEPKRPAH